MMTLDSTDITDPRSFLENILGVKVDIYSQRLTKVVLGFNTEKSLNNATACLEELGLDVRKKNNLLTLNRAQLIQFLYAMFHNPLRWFEDHCDLCSLTSNCVFVPDKLSIADPDSDSGKCGSETCLTDNIPEEDITIGYSKEYRIRAFVTILLHQEFVNQYLVCWPKDFFHDINRGNFRKFIHFMLGEGYHSRLECELDGARMWLPADSPLILMLAALNKGFMQLSSDGNFILSLATLERVIPGFDTEIHLKELAKLDHDNSSVNPLELLRIYKKFYSNFDESLAALREEQIKAIIGCEADDELDQNDEEVDFISIDRKNRMIPALKKVLDIISNKDFIEHFTGDKQVSRSENYLMWLSINIQAEIRYIEVHGKLDLTRLNKKFGAINADIARVLNVYNWAALGVRQPAIAIFNVTKAELIALYSKLCDHNSYDGKDLLLEFSDDPIGAYIEVVSDGRNFLHSFRQLLQDKIKNEPDSLEEEDLQALCVFLTDFMPMVSQVKLSSGFDVRQKVYKVLNSIPLLSMLFSSVMHPAHYRVSAGGPQGEIRYKFANNFYSSSINSDLLLPDLQFPKEVDDDFAMFNDHFRQDRGLIKGFELFVFKIRSCKVAWYIFYFFVAVVLGSASVIARIGVLTGLMPMVVAEGITILRGIIDSSVVIIGIDTIVDFVLYNAVYLVFSLVSFFDRILLGGLICSVVRLCLSLLRGTVKTIGHAGFKSALSIANYGLHASVIILIENIKIAIFHGGLLRNLKTCLLDWLKCTRIAESVHQLHLPDHERVYSKQLTIMLCIPVLSLLAYIYIWVCFAKKNLLVSDYTKKFEAEKLCVDAAIRLKKTLLLPDVSCEAEQFNSVFDAECSMPLKDAQHSCYGALQTVVKTAHGTCTIIDENAAQVKVEQISISLIKDKLLMVNAALRVLSDNKMELILHQSQRLFTLNSSYSDLKHLLRLYAMILDVAAALPVDESRRLLVKLDDVFAEVISQLYFLLKTVELTRANNFPSFLLRRFHGVFPGCHALIMPSELIADVGDVFIVKIGYKNVFDRISGCIKGIMKDWFDPRNILVSVGISMLLTDVLHWNAAIDYLGAIPSVFESMCMSLGLAPVFEHFTETMLAKFVAEVLWTKVETVRDFLYLMQASLAILGRQDRLLVSENDRLLGIFECVSNALTQSDEHASQIETTDLGLEFIQDRGNEIMSEFASVVNYIISASLQLVYVNHIEMLQKHEIPEPFLLNTASEEVCCESKFL